MLQNWLLQRMARGIQSLALAAASLSGAPAAAATQGTSTLKPDATFEAVFAPLYATVFTPEGSFSGKAMSADLQTLEPLLKKPGATARDIFRLYYTQASVYGRRGMPAQAAAAAQTALASWPRIPDTQAHLPEFAYPHFFLRYSSIRWLADSGQHQAALQQVRTLQAQYPLQKLSQLPLEMRWDETVQPARALDYPSQMQILGIHEDEGYLLHELGQFHQAQRANERLLAVARKQLRQHGKLPQLRGVLTNLAQNCHALGELTQAASHLQERLNIALAAQDHVTVYDSYFQLMVLSHEQQQEPQARQWLAHYEQYALSQKDSEQQSRARALLAELAQRSTGRHP